MRIFAFILSGLFLLACDPDAGEPEHIYPDDWTSAYLEVRGCRASPDHDLEYVSLWIDPASKPLWDTCVDAFPEGDSTCTELFPDGATFLKPQYLDPACTQLARLSIARKAPGFASAGGWHWQEVLYQNDVPRVSQDGAIAKCARCHETCPGFDLRCYMDP